MSEAFESEKAEAAAWFGELRDQIVAAFETLEDTQTAGPTADMPAGRFERTVTKRTADDGSNAGGGVMSVMRGGRVFEKVGVNTSEVFGELGPAAQKAINESSSSETCCSPDSSSTTALTSSPHSSLGTPITAASRTAGCSRSRASTAAG